MYTYNVELEPDDSTLIVARYLSVSVALGGRYEGDADVVCVVELLLGRVCCGRHEVIGELRVPCRYEYRGVRNDLVELVVYGRCTQVLSASGVRSILDDDIGRIRADSTSLMWEATACLLTVLISFKLPLFTGVVIRFYLYPFILYFFNLIFQMRLTGRMKSIHPILSLRKLNATQHRRALQG